MTEALTKAGQEHLAVKLRDYAALLRSAAPLADSTGEIPAAVLSHPATALFSAAYLPVEYGGGITDSGTGKRIECSARLCAYIVEEIALGDPGLCCALPGPSLTFPVLNAFGNSDQKRKYFSLFCGEQPVWGGFAITEPHAGTDAFALKTRAAKVAGGYVLNGTKCFITNGERASFFILFATINANLRQFGQRAFIVDRSFPGFSVGTRERMRHLLPPARTDLSSLSALRGSRPCRSAWQVSLVREGGTVSGMPPA